MTANHRRPGRATGLMDRQTERDALDRLVDAVRSGESRALQAAVTHEDGEATTHEDGELREPA